MVRSVAERMAAATARDEAARARDLAAAARDRLARARDDAAEVHDRATGVRPAAGGAAPANGAVRRARATSRAQAALDREAAATDRAAAAADRRQAALDRLAAGLDELTGVFRRGTGVLALQHELDRARRCGDPLSLAMIDVDGLKHVNDADGHAAGDALVGDVARAITATLRAYDVTVRWGGDEFVCALSDTPLEVARHRVAQITRRLAARRPPASVCAGLALLHDADTLESLTARADSALYAAKARAGETRLRPA
jgi:diguanylate cyclase (GGDEF)-like protein